MRKLGIASVLEQALFASSRHGRGYRLLTKSAGVDSELADALTAWAPSHDGLLSPAPDATAVSWWQIAGNDANRRRWCAAFTQTHGAEASARGGANVATRFLIGDEKAWRPWAFDPFALCDALEASSDEQFPSESDQAAPRVTLRAVGREACPWQIAAAGCAFGEAQLHRLVDALQSGKQIALISAHDATLALRGAWNLLAENQRCTLSFTIGLAPSACRPLAIHAVDQGDLPAERLALVTDWRRRSKAAVIELETGDALATAE